MAPISLASLIGGWEVVMILMMILLLPAAVVTAGLLFYFLTRSKGPRSTAVPPAATPDRSIRKLCPQCGAELRPGSPEGLCPVCLLERGLATEGTAPRGQPAFVPPTIQELARLFPQLEIIELIGQGGMGSVYRARQPALDRFVALKILSPPSGTDLDFASRFTREARALARLNHPNIVAVHDFGTIGHASSQSESSAGPEPPRGAEPGVLHYFIMEYVDGRNLRQIERAGKLAPREALLIIPQICAALQFAHDEGIVHRDIKPENILLDRKGRVKIADFGLAKILGQEPSLLRLTGAKDVMGTPHYMAPEQVEKPQEVDHRADIYSLGVVFYEMLTGELPLGQFQRPSQKVQVDVRLDDVVLRSLAKEPERRYQQASQVKTEVETIAASPQAAGGGNLPAMAGSPPPLSTSEAEPPLRLSRTAVIAAVWGLFFIFIFLWWLVPVRTPSPGAAHGVALPIIPIIFLAVPMGILGITAPFGMTILGWIAVDQIRRSAGKLYGLRLAVFDGLFYPLLLLDGICAAVAVLVIRFFASGHGPLKLVNDSQVLSLLIGAAIIIVILDFVLVLWIWRSMQFDTAAPINARRRNKPIVLGGLATVLLASMVAAVLLSPVSRRTKPVDLAYRPDLLRSRTAAEVVQAGLSKPEEPWAWQELESRAKTGQLSSEDGRMIFDGLETWLLQKPPPRYQPMNPWLGNCLRELAQSRLVSEVQILKFLEVYYGNPELELLPRLREGDEDLELTCKLRSPFHDDLLGMIFLNELRSITVDGQPVATRDTFRRSWQSDHHVCELLLPTLAPGKHVVRCDVQSALIPKDDVVGLNASAPSTEWPPAKRTWSRSCQAEFTVFPTNAEIVSLTVDPSLDPVARGTLAAKQVIVRPKGGRTIAVIVLQIENEQPVPVSFNITLRLEGRNYDCGQFWKESRSTGYRFGTAGGELTAIVDEPDPQVTTADVILTPNSKLIESRANVERIWGKEIVFDHVPLIRQNLSPIEATTNVSPQKTEDAGAAHQD